MKLKTDDGKEYDEEVKIDTQKGTETFHVPKTSPDNEEADIVLDFNKVSDYLAGAFTSLKSLSAFDEVIFQQFFAELYDGPHARRQSVLSESIY